MNQPTAKPTSKVAAAGISGAVTTIIIYLASMGGLEMPPEVAAAVTAVLAFVAGYWIKERS